MAGRFGSSHLALAMRGAWNSHNLFLKTSACDCGCESKGNAGLREVNVLTPILSPCVAWRCLRVEQAMGIEPKRTFLQSL